MIEHPIKPVYNEKSKILILGSFPSVKSREENFFYGNPLNRFWKVISGVLNCAEPITTEEKRKLLLSSGIAIWDVIASCEIVGSSDSSIKSVIANDISIITNSAEIVQIFVNGKTAEKYYKRYIENKIKREAICLPSTSPANASYNLSRLISAWAQINNFLKI